MKKRYGTISVVMLLIFCFCAILGTLNAFGLENANPSAEASGKIVEVQIPAPSLSNNVIGESDTQPVSVYLPASYDTGTKNYPVVYFLHGWAEELKAYREGPYFKMKETMDKLIEEKKCQEMIVVMTNGNTKYLGSFYTNSSVTGNWEDYIVKDLVSYVDSNYRTVKDAKARGLGGFSMGGYGALNISMKHPDTFGSVYALSPGLFKVNGLATTFMYDSEDTIKEVIRLEKEYDAKPLSEGRKELYENIINWKLPFQFIFSVSYGSSFSPNPDKVVPFDYPYTLENGELVLDKAVWEKWESGFGGIENEIGKYKENLQKLGEIRIDYGVNDENKWIPDGCRYFAKQLKKQGIPYTLLTFDGKHEDKVSERIENYIMPYFSKRFSGSAQIASNSKTAPEEYRLENWSKDPVNTLWEKDLADPDIFAGYNNSITREEFAMLSVRLVERLTGKACEKADAASFNDIDKSPYAEDILKAFKLGITSGKGNNKFDPTGLITRQEMATMTYNMLKAVKPEGDYKAKTVARFADEKEISSWAKDAHLFLFEKGIITGKGKNTISPLANTSRQEALVIDYRTAKLLGVIE